MRRSPPARAASAGPSHRTRTVVVLAATLAVGAAPAWLHAQAQDGLPDPADTVVASAPRCRGETIREIVVYSAAPTVDRVQRLPVIGALARAAHVTTQQEIVRGFLLLHEGERCTELARAESERVLRAQPYIADAGIGVVRVEGGVRLEVRTIDEASLLLGTRLSSGNPYVRSVRIGNTNVGGAGVALSGEWRYGGLARDGAGVRLTDHQFLGHPYELDLEARRAPLGGEWHTALTRPFLTGLQRHAWRASGGEHTAFAELRHPDSVVHAVRVARAYSDAGALARIGSPVRMGLVGVVLSYEHERVDSTLRAFTQPGAPPVAVGPFAGSADRSATRLNAFVGFRALSFVPVRGFDGLLSTQDIPIGLQAGVVAGRGLGGSGGGGRRELFLAGDVYAGHGDSTRATRVQLRGQGTRSGEDGDWGRMLVTGRIAHQRKPTPARTIELSGEWAGVWRSGLPLQLMLGARDGGVRGFAGSNAGGSRRARARIEGRHAFADVKGLGDLGIGGFVDAGRVWRGAVPFGVTTPIRSSIGLSILAAVPTRSSRLWRLDVALPVNGREAGRLELGLSNGDRSAVFWREPADLGLMRGRAVPTSVFAWP